MRKLHFRILLTALCTLPYGLVLGQTSGTLEIRTNTTLTQDHNGTIVILADMVTLDCASRTVIAGRSLNAIRVEGRTGVTVRNCIIRDSLNGVFIRNSRNNTFIDNQAINNTLNGFRIEQSNENMFIRNTAQSNGTRERIPGVCDPPPDQPLACGDGFDLNDSHGNTLILNVASQNVENGIEMDRCNNNIFQENIANQNGQHGFSLDDSNGNTFTGNIANNNTERGFQIVRRNHDNKFFNNEASSNGRGDARQRDSFRNLFSDNRFATEDGIGTILPPTGAD